VPQSHLNGRAFVIYWSFASELDGYEPVGLRVKIRQLGSVALEFFTHTRWSRTFHLVR
jgi:signal peptidase I